MQDIDEEEPVEVEEVLKVVTATKLITEVVTNAEPTTTTAAQVPKLEAELNANINWNDVMEKVKRSERQNNAVMRNDHSQIRPLFEKHYNLIQAFLKKVEEEVTMQEKEIKEEGNKRQGKSLEQEIAKKQRMDEE
nr:hypothetical protein [Tanacetum cinerariifolium]